MRPLFSSAIITCEHAGNDVPQEYQPLFIGATEILQSHRGWDPGAIEIAERLASKSNVPLFRFNVTRLLIEANRSIDHPQLFSDYSKSLPERKKEEIKQQYYFPYRKRVELFIQSLPQPILHLSVHTFTHELDKVKRTTDIGLLFDPVRKLESDCCLHLRDKLTLTLPTFQVDFNKPYLGTDDGFTTYLREKFEDEDYAGIEIEINQKYVSETDHQKISQSVHEVLEEILV